jgi:transposase
MNIMHTMASETRPTPSRTRRFYSPELKLQVVGTCAQPGASIAGVAMQHGINANMNRPGFHGGPLG